MGGGEERISGKSGLQVAQLGLVGEASRAARDPDSSR